MFKNFHCSEEKLSRGDLFGNHNKNCPYIGQKQKDVNWILQHLICVAAMNAQSKYSGWLCGSTTSITSAHPVNQTVGVMKKVFISYLIEAN